MDESIKNILSDGGEILLDSLLENSVLKEIPVIGTSLNIIKGVISLRDKAYLNKVKKFIENIGEIDKNQKDLLIKESREDEKRRVKFGDALFTTLEQSDSLLKVEYLAVAFESFLNKNVDSSDLRLMCHAIRNTFIDDLIEIIEAENINQETLEYNISNGVSLVTYPQLTFDRNNMAPTYTTSNTTDQLRDAWRMYKK
ncbi:hypothetical protein [Algibacter sp. PT7-4]|uniref:hypothetical protein n=1 Tax=Algibacter ulvanivorans TaxID=3400999 RepID=UPI003AABABBE